MFIVFSPFLLGFFYNPQYTVIPLVWIPVSSQNPPGFYSPPKLLLDQALGQGPTTSLVKSRDNWRAFWIFFFQLKIGQQKTVGKLSNYFDVELIKLSKRKLLCTSAANELVLLHNLPFWKAQSCEFPNKNPPQKCRLPHAADAFLPEGCRSLALDLYCRGIKSRFPAGKLLARDIHPPPITANAVWWVKK